MTDVFAGLEDAQDVGTAVDSDPSTAVLRKRFHEEVASGLAKAVGLNAKRSNKPSEKFAYFEDTERFVVVAGAQEKHETAQALARGLGLRGERQLVLVLPDAHCFATMQRVPWLRTDACPEVWTYGTGSPVKQDLKSEAQTRDALKGRLEPNQSLEEELLASTTPKHLGAHSKSVWNLVEWATSHGQLDPSHLRGERAWHCLGQKVLSIKSTRSGLAIRAGIHYSGAKAPQPVMVTSAKPLTKERFEGVRTAVEAAIELRLDSEDPQIHKADEHWLQAVIRRDPALVGVEQPALREFPAWRPRDDSKMWGRGFIDLMGVDGHGNIRIVETKVATNADEMLILQGLDYYIWAKVYENEIRRRLSVSRNSDFEIHYVIGDSHGELYVAHHAHAQASALDESIPWRFQTIAGWFGHPDPNSRPTSRLLAEGELPPTKGELAK